MSFTALAAWAALMLAALTALLALRRAQATRVQLAAAEGRCREQRTLTDAAEAARAVAEARARTAEERYQLALRSSLDGTWEWDIARGRTQLSPRWKGMLGFGPEELGPTREDWLARVHADDRPGFVAALERAQQGVDTRLEHELRLLHRDGSVRHVLTRGMLLRDEAGHPERLIGLDTDVTRLKRVQAVLDAVADGTAGANGERFFAAMAEHFARALDVDCAFITECADQPPTRVRTLAFWSADQGLAPNFEYELAGTPCEEVVQGARTCFHPSELARRYPREQGWEAYVGMPIVASDGRVLGHLALLDRQPLGDEVLVERVYRIFLARAAAEIERAQALARLALLGSGLRTA